MIPDLKNEMTQLKTDYNLSLAQFGAMVGASAVSVKRWMEGVKPQEPYAFQIVLVLGLINDPEEVYYDLGRQGIEIQKTDWDGFAGLIDSAKRSIAVAAELGLPAPEINMAMVSGVKGLLSLIALKLAAGNPIGARFTSSLTTRVADFLK